MATDQEIRDAGFKYIPQQKYLQNPYNLPIAPVPPPASGGITNTNAFNNSGNDFSVYNPDPNSIVNRNYNEDPYKSYLYKDRFPMMGDPVANQATGALNADGLMSYAGDKPQSKFQEMLSKGISFIPGVGMAKKGLDALSNMLPPNRRAIMENELSGQGIMVNDIGQIVGDGGAAYKEDGSNIMAGYNANKITQETFNKRRTKAEKNMSADGFKEFNKALTAAEERILGTATDRANIIYADDEEEKNKKKKKGTIINRFITKKKETKAAKDMVDVEAVKANIKKAEDAAYYTPDGTPGGGAGQGIDISGAGNIRSSDNNFQGDSGPTTQQESDYGYGPDFGFAKGGRAGYFFGGRAGYANGQLVTPSEDGSRPGYRGSDMASVGTSTRAANTSQKDTSGADYGGGNQGRDAATSSGVDDRSSFEQNVNHQRAMRDNQREKPSTLDNVMNLGSELSYLNNIKNLNVPGIAINFGVNKFRNYMKNKNIKEEDKLSALPTSNYMGSRYDTGLEENIDNPKFSMENMFGITSQVPENMQLAKVYGAPELTKFGATPGTFMDTDKFNDMEKYQELANKQMSFDPVDGSYRGKQPNAIRESISVGDALYGINMDNIPKDFLETQDDYKKQKILGNIKFSKGGRAMFKNGGLASIL